MLPDVDGKVEGKGAPSKTQLYAIGNTVAFDEQVRRPSACWAGRILVGNDLGLLGPQEREYAGRQHIGEIAGFALYDFALNTTQFPGKFGS
jgi:hypothetical protein